MSTSLVTQANTPAGYHRLARLYRFARSHGFLRALIRLVHAVSEAPLLRHCCRLTVAEAYVAGVAELKQGGAIPRAFEVREAGEEDEPAVAEYFEDAQLVRRRFRRGDVCVITLVRGQVAAAVWFTAGPVEYHEDWNTLGRVFRIPEGAAWSFDGKGTRMGAWGSLMARFPGIVQQHGCREVHTLIDYDNVPSIDAHRSLGYRRAGLIACLKVFGLALRLHRLDGGKWRLGRGRIGCIACDGQRAAAGK